MAIDYSPQLERLARVFNDNTQPPKIIPTKPDDPQSVLSLPPQNLKDFHKQTTPEQVVEQRLEQIGVSTSTPKSLNTKETTDTTSHLAQAPTEQPFLTKEQTQNIQKQEQEQQQLERAVVEQQQQQQSQNVDVLEQTEKVSQPTRGRGRPKGSKNKNKTGIEKVSHSQARAEMKKLSRASDSQFLPVNISVPSQTSVKGKTSLCYALIYARELTPIQIEALLAKKDEMSLTSAEVIALSLIDRTIKHDQKAEKIYWDLLKNEQKNNKITPVKAENTLLDEALAKAENAIFGEVVDKPE